MFIFTAVKWCRDPSSNYFLVSITLYPDVGDDESIILWNFGDCFKSGFKLIEGFLQTSPSPRSQVAGRRTKRKVRSFCLCCFGVQRFKQGRSYILGLKACQDTWYRDLEIPYRGPSKSVQIWCRSSSLSRSTSPSISHRHRYPRQSWILNFTP